MTQEELIKKIDAEIAKLSDNASQMCEEYEGYRIACQDISDVLHEIAKEIQPSLSSNLDEIAEEYADSMGLKGFDKVRTMSDFKAGVEWRDNQMKMPNSSELISAWYGVKSILQEKDFRGDEWRLAYNAFMSGFSKGLNTQNGKEMKNEELKEAIAKYIESKELVLMGYSPEYIDDVKTDMEIAFRAGVDWMARQGKIVDGYISIRGKRSLIAVVDRLEEFKYGDKVIVQIRKKE